MGKTKERPSHEKGPFNTYLKTNITKRVIIKWGWVGGEKRAEKQQISKRDFPASENKKKDRVWGCQDSGFEIYEILSWSRKFCLAAGKTFKFASQSEWMFITVCLQWRLKVESQELIRCFHLKKNLKLKVFTWMSAWTALRRMIRL